VWFFGSCKAGVPPAACDELLPAEHASTHACVTRCVACPWLCAEPQAGICQCCCNTGAEYGEACLAVYYLTSLGCKKFSYKHDLPWLQNCHGAGVLTEHAVVPLTTSKAWPRPTFCTFSAGTGCMFLFVVCDFDLRSGRWCREMAG
jgi:hypothetical protein